MERKYFKWSHADIEEQDLKGLEYKVGVAKNVENALSMRGETVSVNRSSGPKQAWIFVHNCFLSSTLQLKASKGRFFLQNWISMILISIISYNLVP